MGCRIGPGEHDRQVGCVGEREVSDAGVGVHPGSGQGGDTDGSPGGDRGQPVVDIGHGDGGGGPRRDRPQVEGGGARDRALGPDRSPVSQGRRPGAGRQCRRPDQPADRRDPAGTALVTPTALGLGAAVAVLSAALPYSLELLALRALPAATFAVLMSLAPAIAATAGYLVLHQALNLSAVLAIALVIAASIGAVRSAASPQEGATTSPRPTAPSSSSVA